MKLLIVNNMAPFVWGGAEELAIHLQKNLIIAGHEAEILRIPFAWEPYAKIPSQMLMVRAFELTNADQIIALKFPAYLIRHPKKTLWLLHQYRQAYELQGTKYSNLPQDAQGEQLKQIIKSADEETFQEARKIFTNSEITQQRLLHNNKFAAEVLHPPLNDPELFHGLPSEGYIFAGGRVNNMKRQHLLIEAVALSSVKAKLIIAGPPDTPDDALRLKQLVEKFNLQDRVKLDLRLLSRLELAEYVNKALVCAYLPYEEDSLGYVAMEAAMAGKALISTYDSGGILGLVKHGQTGWLAPPQPMLLADLINQIYANKTFTHERGRALHDYWMNMEITWPNTIKRLLA